MKWRLSVSKNGTQRLLVRIGSLDPLFANLAGGTEWRTFAEFEAPDIERAAVIAKEIPSDLPC